MNPVQMAVRVLRADRRSRTSAILTAAGVAVATALVLLLLGVPGATQERAERGAWQEATYTGGENPAATLSFASTEDYVDGDQITRVDVAALAPPQQLRLPPGIDRLPAPGESLVSPALAARIADRPASELGDRFGKAIIGTLDAPALTSPEQLVALVGHTPQQMPQDAAQLDGFPAGPGTVDATLQLLAGVGIVVLLVPSLVLVASASRLIAARRERRLAALRLAGATPGQIVGMVTAETALAAGVGAVAGVLLCPGLRMLSSNVSWDGGTFLAQDFSLPLWVNVLVALALAVLVVLAAVLGLRRVLVAPLSAAGQHGHKGPRWWRLLALPAVGLAFVYALSEAQETGAIALLLGALALVIVSATVVGPWVTAAVGRLFVRSWHGPAGLLAGRRLVEDPKGAYRASSGVVLAVFTGSMALTLLPSISAMSGAGGTYQDQVLYGYADSKTASAIVQQANDRLAEYKVDERAVSVPQLRIGAPIDSPEMYQTALVLDCQRAKQLLRTTDGLHCQDKPAIYGLVPTSGNRVAVRAGNAKVTLPASTPVVGSSGAQFDNTLLIDPRLVPKAASIDGYEIAVPATEANRERVRTALLSATAGTQIQSRETVLGDQQTELADLRRVTVIGLVAAGLLAGASAAIATAGSVMDRRKTFGALLAAGTPVRILARSLRTEAALPAMVATAGAGFGGVLIGMGLLTLLQEGAPVITPWVLAPAVLGVGVALMAASVCKPALNRVRAEPLAEE